MKRWTSIAGLIIFGGSALAAAGQAPSAAAAEGGPVTIEYYYKLVPGAMVPGGQGEWLALYLKNHNPILREHIKAGLIKSEKLYERRFHAQEPAWDYKVVMVWHDWAALQEASRKEPEIVRSLYPNKADHDREEKRRWELTERHWDDVLREVPLE